MEINHNSVRYKTSRYNYLIEYNNKKLLFNGLTGAGFCMSNKEYENLHPLLQNLYSFQEKYPDDFTRLNKLGYIIEENFDELIFIKYKNREAVFLDRFYKLVINPTLECNFNCWYCYEEHPKGFMTKDTIKKIQNHIKKKILDKEITSLNLSWFGGEPLLYFYEVVQPISIFARKICEEYKIPFISTITTNAFLIDKKMADAFNTIGLKGFQITLDGGKDRHNKIRNQNGTPSYDVIIKNINLLCEKIKDITITLRINYDDKTLKLNGINDILSDIDLKYRGKIHVNMQRVWQTGTDKQGDKKNEELLSFVNNSKKAGYSYTTCGGGLSVGTFHTCYVSRQQHLEINYDGKVYKCTARGYDDKYVVGKLLENGAIEWNYEKISKIYASPSFENPMCIPCDYLPICSGPCPQKMIETPPDKLGDICLLKNSEQPIKDMIINFYELSLRNKK